MPYLANIDGIIWLIIIVVSIIAQVIKGAKKFQSAAPQQQPNRSTPDAERWDAERSADKPAPQPSQNNEELRNFLENLGLPVQQLAPRPPPIKRQSRPRKSPPAPERLSNARVMQTPLPRKTVAPAETSQTRQRPATRELRNLLKNRHSQRQAILLKEILGAPIALR
ncbi:MAG: hypothetical protein ACNA71_07515 [Kiritimatiellia bacterium]